MQTGGVGATLKAYPVKGETGMFTRSSGVLLHITSLPGPYGCGTFGGGARSFIDFLAESGFSWWQVLPFSPPDLGNSPYTAYSAFAGNPIMIDPALLHQQGLITGEELEEAAAMNDPYTVRFDQVIPARMKLLRTAYGRAQPALRRKIAGFAEDEPWVRSYGLFMALKAQYQDLPWYAWPDGRIRMYRPDAVAQAMNQLAGPVDFQIFIQYCFFTQWRALRTYARERGIGIIGDMPIYMSLNSADVWANQHLFALKDGRPEAVAGVPPDAFTDEGQLWGNPLYDYKAMAADGYAWWLERIGKALASFDAVRIDHFRGFSAYWSVPAGAKSAREGHWVKGPGLKLFKRVADRFPDAPIIAEDLGVLDEDVHTLREKTGYPGMRVMQFAFAPGNGPHLPHNYPVNAVAYTGTHDNNTTLGWLWESPEQVRSYACRYAGLEGPWQEGGPHSPACRAMMRCLWQSPASLAIVPFQDIMGWGEDTRMNRPGVAEGCWAVRIGPDALGQADRSWLRQLNLDFERTGK